MPDYDPPNRVFSAHNRTRAQWRNRIRTIPVLAQLWQAAVFVAGLLCIVVGLLLLVLPGPFTIPPVLLGLWVWSTEFRWATKRFIVLKRKVDPQMERFKRNRMWTALFGVASATIVVIIVSALRD